MKQQIATDRKVWHSTLIIVLIVALFFLLPQLSVIILSALMAFVFYPLFNRLRRKKGWAAAGFTLLVSILLVVIPVTIVIVITAAQLLNFTGSMASSEGLQNISQFLSGASDNINAILRPFTDTTVDFSRQGITTFLQNTLPEIARTVAGVLLGFLGNFPQLAIATIIYCFVFVELLVRGPRYIEAVYDISPFDHTTSRLYLERIGLMANAMMKGQLMISMIISALSTLLLIPLGFGEYAFVIFLLFTILNFIPLGCGIVMIPLIIITGLTGQFWPSLIVLVLYCIVANIDSVIRPIFIPKKIQLSTALTMIATFCGLAYFGILGVVYGPIIMIIIVTTLALYRENKPSFER